MRSTCHGTGRRFNRRFREKGLFDRLIRVCVSTGTITYDKLTRDAGPDGED